MADHARQRGIDGLGKLGGELPPAERVEFRSFVAGGGDGDSDHGVRVAEIVTDMAPDGLNHCFFTNSGSESVDTALKIAIGYHSALGKPRHRLVGRERGYHGVGLGGISVGGMTPNRKVFSAALLPGVDHSLAVWMSMGIVIADR